METQTCRLSVSFHKAISVLPKFDFVSEVILTLGSSRTVLEFLCAAKEKKRSFRVFIAEGAPRFGLSFYYMCHPYHCYCFLLCATFSSAL